MNQWNLPNLLTLCGIPIAVAFLVYAIEGRWMIAFWLFVIGALTDMVDGTLARLLHKKTNTGAFLDPMADKLLMFFGFLTLTLNHLIPWWLFALVFARDLMISLGVFYLRSRKIPLVYHPTILSKATTFFQFLTVSLALYAAAFGAVRGEGYGQWITGVLTAVTGVQYFTIGLKLLGDNSPPLP